jgi:hypothetical protein
MRNRALRVCVVASLMFLACAKASCVDREAGPQSKSSHERPPAGRGGGERPTLSDTLA